MKEFRGDSDDVSFYPVILWASGPYSEPAEGTILKDLQFNPETYITTGILKSQVIYMCVYFP